MQAHRRASRINDATQAATARRMSYAPQAHRRSSVATSSSYLAGGLVTKNKTPITCMLCLYIV